MDRAGIWFLLLALLSELLGTVGGFGSSIYMVPLGQYIYPLQAVLALTALLHVFGNSSRLFLFHKSIHWPTTLWFAVPSILLTLLGAWLTDRLATVWISRVMGGFMIAYSLWMLIRKGWYVNPTRLNAGILGGVSGFLTGLIGTGGAIRAAGLVSFNLSKEAFIATSAAIDFGNDMGRFWVYFGKGYFPTENWMVAVLLFPMAYAGSWIGKRLVQRLSTDSFRKIILYLILAIGLLTLYNSVCTVPAPISSIRTGVGVLSPY